LTEVEVYQPPQNGYHCRVCGAKITSVAKSRLCRKCCARRLGLRVGGWNKNRVEKTLKEKGDDEK